MSKEDHRLNNENLSLFLHYWQDDNVFIISIDKNEINKFKTKITKLKKERMCAIIQIIEEDCKKNEYILLYRDSANDDRFGIYNEENIKLKFGCMQNNINLPIPDEQQSGACFPAMCFLGMMHKQLPYMKMENIVELLCDSRYKDSLDDIFKRYNNFLNTFPNGENVIDTEFRELIRTS